MSRARRSVSMLASLLVSLCAAQSRGAEVDPIPALVAEHARYWAAAMPTGMPESVRNSPLRMLDQFRWSVATLGPDARISLTEGDTVLTARSKDYSRQVQLLVSDPKWGSTPMVSFSVHTRVPGGLGEVARTHLSTFASDTRKDDNTYEWQILGASLAQGAWTGRDWRGDQQLWQPLGKGKWYAVELKEIGKTSWQTRVVARREFVSSPKGKAPVRHRLGTRLDDTVRGGYRLRTTPYFVEWSKLRAAGVEPIVDVRGRHYLRRSAGREPRLRDLGLTFVRRGKNGTRAHLRAVVKARPVAGSR